MITKLWNWCRQSATIVWARIVMLLSGIVAILPTLGADPNFNTFLSGYLTPRNVALAMMLIGVITEMARRRTAGKGDGK